MIAAVANQLTAARTHMPYGITQRLGGGDIPVLT